MFPMPEQLNKALLVGFLQDAVVAENIAFFVAGAATE